MCEGGTELPAIVTATSVFAATGQRPAAVTAGRGFSHSFSCILNERNQVLVLRYSVAVAHPRNYTDIIDMQNVVMYRNTSHKELTEII